jgi:hypothetical protein
MYLPLETHVVSNSDTEEFEEEYQPVVDPLLVRYLNARKRTGYESPLQSQSFWQRIHSKFPLSPNVTECEFVPTMQFRFLEILRDKFPNHRLILSDFDSLPTEVPGINAPIVQTRQRYRMIPCSTYLVTPGWFDIFFPTNFEQMRTMYDLIMEKKCSEVISHRKFLERYSKLENITTKSGEVPMFEQYANVSFLIS